MLVVRNIHNTINSYHDILVDIDYAKTWVEATEKIPCLYKGEIVEEHYVRWRDERTMDEIGWYGWLIDYWMEGRILRDYFDHKLTTKEHWDKLRQPETFAYGELQWDVNNCENVSLGVCVCVRHVPVLFMTHPSKYSYRKLSQSFTMKNVILHTLQTARPK